MNENTTKREVATKDTLAAIPFSREAGIQLQSLGDASNLADLIVKGGYAPKGSTKESVTLAIIQGAALGLNPLQSAQGIAVINGRPSLWGDSLRAIVKGSPLFGGETVEYFSGEEGKPDNAGCRVTVWRNGQTENPAVGEFTVGDAKRAGLWGKAGPWTTYPKRMLLARASTFAYRDAFPDLLQGITSREEAEDSNIIEGETVAAPTPAPKKAEDKLRAALKLPPANASGELPMELPEAEKTPVQDI